MQRIIQLESKAITAGGNVGVSLKGLPPMSRVRYIVLRAEGLFTTGAAAAIIAGKELFRYFSNIEIQSDAGTVVKTTGEGLHFLNWLMRGAEDYLPASIPAVNASAYRRTISVVIPFYDGAAWSPTDLCPNAESFNDSTLNVDFGALSAAANGNTLASIAGTLRTFVVCDDSNGQVSALARIGYQDFQAQTCILDPGLYTHVFAYKEDTAVFTSLEVSSVSCRSDNVPVISTARAEELAYLHDYIRASGGAFQTGSATVPVAGEHLVDEPANTAGAAATVSPEFIPLVTPCHGYKLTQAIKVEQGLQFDFTGSLSAYRLGFRRVDPRNESAAVNALNRVGVPVTSAAQIVAKTESKAPLSAGKRGFMRFFPLRGK